MPRLVIHAGDGLGRDQALGAGECVVGRGPGADFTVEDVGLSRRHFRIVASAGTWSLEDLGSTNGTFLNGRRTTRAALKDGDVVRAGTTEWRFVQKDMLGGARPAAPVPTRRRRLR